MYDPAVLLATLAQSSAAIVAIVGGFLVSRLVALSSEREGIRRQLVSVLDRLEHVRDDYNEAPKYRLANSKSDFFGWVIDDLVNASGGEVDYDGLLDENIPRGSSPDEMRPYLEDLHLRVLAAERAIRGVLRQGDADDVSLGDLISRGLDVPDGEREIYEHMVNHIAERELPTRQVGPLGAPMPSIRQYMLASAGNVAVDSRRLDESIRDEQQLATQMAVLEADERRLVAELEAIGRPNSVLPAILILALYSLLGIMVPVVVLAAEPKHISAAGEAILIGLFGIGLLAVLGYMFWYSKTLDDNVESSVQPPPSHDDEERLVRYRSRLMAFGKG